MFPSFLPIILKIMHSLLPPTKIIKGINERTLYRYMFMCVCVGCVCVCTERGRERGERGSCVCQTTLNKTISGLSCCTFKQGKNCLENILPVPINPLTTSLSHTSAQDFPATCRSPSSPSLPTGSLSHWWPKGLLLLLSWTSTNTPEQHHLLTHCHTFHLVFTAAKTMCSKRQNLNYRHKRSLST